MAKKEFKSGLDMLFQSTDEVESLIVKDELKTNKIIKNDETRATFIVDNDQLLKLKALSFWQRKQLKQILREIIDLYFESIDKKEFEKALFEYKNFMKT